MKKTVLFCLLVSGVSTFGRGTSPNIATQPQSQIAEACGTATFSVTANGVGPFSYQWQFNGTNLSNNIIITAAGTGTPGFSGDGGPAIDAELYGCCDVALDASGNMYVSDGGNGRIRKVDTNGIITTIAGNGGVTYSGDGGKATNGSFNGPGGIAADASGNVYVADQYNNRIRKIGTNGIITTYAGNGNNSFGGDGGQATNAALNQPTSVVLDKAGNLYIADIWNDRVRKVSTNGIITTVVGSGQAGGLGGFSGDGGPATNAQLALDTWVCFDNQGNMFVSDRDNQRIRKVNTNGIITTAVGDGNGGYAGDGGPATNASLNYPYGIRADAAGNLYIDDNENQRIREVGTNGIITTLVGTGNATYSGDGGPPGNASLNNPFGLAISATGQLFIADDGNNRIREVSLTPNASPTLTLLNLTATNVGSYTVIVSNAFGSVTSSPAILQLTPSPATATATLSGDFVTAATITEAGCGYTNAPMVLIQGGEGSGAAGFAVISNGMVAGITITNAGYGYSNAPTIWIGEPPVIAVEPESLTVNAFDTTLLSVEAISTVPLSYQWAFDGTNMPGATSSELVISNTVATNLGSYAVVVSNVFGVTNSSAAVLTMYPYLADPFGGSTTYWGYTNTISVGAWGSGPLAYQWYDNGTAIAGATSSNLTFDGVQLTNGGLYSVVVTSPFGSVTNTPEQMVVEPSGVTIGLSPTLTISGVPGYNYTIQRTPSLSNTNWVTLANITLTNAVEIWVDTNLDASLPASPAQFYRVVPGQ